MAMKPWSCTTFLEPMILCGICGFIIGTVYEFSPHTGNWNHVGYFVAGGVSFGLLFPILLAMIFRILECAGKAL